MHFILAQKNSVVNQNSQKNLSGIQKECKLIQQRRKSFVRIVKSTVEKEEGGLLAQPTSLWLGMLSVSDDIT